LTLCKGKLIHTMPCSDHAALQATSQGHGTARQGHGMDTALYRMWINIGRPSTACRLSAQFWFFRLLRGVSRKTRHCRSKTGTQHVLRELKRHGTAGARYGTCELALTLPYFLHDRSNWSYPCFNSTTFKNFPGTSDLLYEMSKFQHHTTLCTKCGTLLASFWNLSPICESTEYLSCWMLLLPWQSWI
jgi:hypothetical protein